MVRVWQFRKDRTQEEEGSRLRERRKEGRGRETERRERAVRKICQDLRAQNSPHGCPECKEFFVPLSFAFGAAALCYCNVRENRIATATWPRMPCPSFVGT